MSEQLDKLHRRAIGRSWSYVTALLLALTLMALTSSVFAHNLNVFAWVDGDEVVVEGKFSTGKRPVSGRVTVYDGYDKQLLKTELQQDGSVRFPLPNYESGLKVELSTSGGHDSFWILTPHDIDSQRKSEKSQIEEENNRAKSASEEDSDVKPQAEEENNRAKSASEEVSDVKPPKSASEEDSSEKPQSEEESNNEKSQAGEDDCEKRK